MGLHNIKSPGSQTMRTQDGVLKLSYNNKFIKNFNNKLYLTQKFLDNEVGKHLMAYVSKDSGNQEGSIAEANTYGKGYVIINVSYAEYQAYSKKIKKRVGKRGTQPFERMKADKNSEILRAVQNYSRRLNG